MECNGRNALCNLAFDEVTFLASHNAPAYDFRPFGMFRSRILNCAYADHSDNEVKQLKRGVRMFDMDTCVRKGVIHSCHGEGYKARVKRPLKDELIEIRDWLNEPKHRNEVIMLSFGDHDPSPEATSEAARLIAEVLREVFAYPGLALKTQEVIDHRGDSRSEWPSLGHMVTTGMRVVLMVEGDPNKMKNNLYDYLPAYSKEFIFNLAEYFEYTWGGANEADDYEGLLRRLKFFCEDDDRYLYKKRAIHLDAFMTLQFKIRGDSKKGTHRVQRLKGSSFAEEPVANASCDLTDEELENSIELVEQKSVKGCFCTDCLARNFNEAVTRKRGSRQTSVLEEAQRLCHDGSGAKDIRVHAVKMDFEEYGDFVRVVDRMNDRNMERYCPECEKDKLDFLDWLIDSGGRPGPMHAMIALVLALGLFAN
jgi:hypothetical protein